VDGLLMPHFDARARLASHVNGLRSQSSVADILLTLKYTRELLESKGLKRNFPTLSLYCSWYLHQVLDQQRLGWQILVDINDGLWDQTGLNPIAVVGSALRWGALRGEAIDLFTSQKVNPFLFIHESNWVAFSSMLLSDLCEKSIRWPAVPTKGPSRDLFGRMLQKTFGPDIYTRELSIEYLPEGYEGPGFYWNIECKRDGPFAATLKGPLVAPLLIHSREPNSTSPLAPPPPSAIY
jgi:hypothetical protein